MYHFFSENTFSFFSIALTRFCDRKKSVRIIEEPITYNLLEKRGFIFPFFSNLINNTGKLQADQRVTIIKPRMIHPCHEVDGIRHMGTNDLFAMKLHLMKRAGNEIFVKTGFRRLH